MEHLYHFELNQDPFQNEPDLRFYFESAAHRRAQLRVDRALRQSKGLTLLTGEGGTGKSLLARRIYEGLEDEVIEAALMVMMQGTADATSVLRRFAAQLGAEEPAADRPALLAQLYDLLAIVREDGRHAVLILDDAHVLSAGAMAEIAGLLNLEYEDRRLVSLLLVGMPELDSIVAGVPSLGKRIDVRVPLNPLSEQDAVAYLAHRVEAANGKPGIFEDSALQQIFKHAGGRPRHMNSLADNALFEAYLSDSQHVRAADVATAAADLGLETAGAPPAAAPGAAPRTAPAAAPDAAPSTAPAAAADAAPVLTVVPDPAPDEAPAFAPPPYVEPPSPAPAEAAPPPSPGSAEVTNPFTDDELSGGDIEFSAAPPPTPPSDSVGDLLADDDGLGSLIDDATSSRDLASALALDDAPAEELDLDAPLEGDDDLLSFETPALAEEEPANPIAPDTTLEAEIVMDETDSEEIDNLFVELLEE